MCRPVPRSKSDSKPGDKDPARDGVADISNQMGSAAERVVCGCGAKVGGAHMRCMCVWLCRRGAAGRGERCGAMADINNQMGSAPVLESTWWAHVGQARLDRVARKGLRVFLA